MYEPRGIQVIQSPDAWGAIANGAVLSRVANQGSVTSTKAVRHYGVVVRSEYDSLADRGRPIKFMLGDNREKVDKLIWYIYKGDDLERGQTIKFPLYRTIRKDFTPQELIFFSDLSFSEDRVAPAYPGSTVKTCCTLRADLTAAPRSKFRERVGCDGRSYYDVNYELSLSTAHANFRFSLEMDGKEMGSIEATYN